MRRGDLTERRACHHRYQSAHGSRLRVRTRACRLNQIQMREQCDPGDGEVEVAGGLMGLFEVGRSWSLAIQGPGN